MLEGRRHQVTVNEPPNALHGGACGFDRRDWALAWAGEHEAVLRYTSADGEEGFPGRLDVEVAYTLVRNALRIRYRATTDATTVVNLTNHAYWNLGGTLEDHVLRVDASRFVAVDARGIPTGVEAVDGTTFDFRTPRSIGGQRLDHSFVLDGPLTLRGPTGIGLEVMTTEPGVHVYTGDKLSSPRAGIALETQHFPDSPNHPEFPSVVLRPGEVYASETTFTFG